MEKNEQNLLHIPLSCAIIYIDLSSEGKGFMIGKISNVKIVSSFKNKSKAYNKIQSRKTHGFIFKIEGYTEYEINGKKLRANEGDLIFLPKGACYEYVSNSTVYTSINFEADIDDPEVAIYSLKDFAAANSMLRSFSETWNLGNDSDKYKCISDLYALISYISRIDHSESEERGKYRIIEPSLNYLRKHIFDQDLKVSSLHRLCGISDTYFRRLFLLKFNMTPQKYITGERLSRAKLIIESGDYDNLSAVSESVGFADPLYFSKAFKKHYGFPPSELVE
jgi:AraC-like DNA-binding protein